MLFRSEPELPAHPWARSGGKFRFKISGRNRPTDWLVRAAEAYTSRQYHGNLLDLLSFVQIKGPRQALSKLSERGVAPDVVEPLQEAFAALDDVVIDNDAFPRGFLRRIAHTDCEHQRCEECGYCGTVAEKVVRIGGRAPSQYRPPRDLPTIAGLMEEFGTGSVALPADASRTPLARPGEGDSFGP